jgi:hypothetical protein
MRFQALAKKLFEKLGNWQVIRKGEEFYSSTCTYPTPTPTFCYKLRNRLEKVWCEDEIRNFYLLITMDFLTLKPEYIILEYKNQRGSNLVSINLLFDRSSREFYLDRKDCILRRGIVFKEVKKTQLVDKEEPSFWKRIFRKEGKKEKVRIIETKILPEEKTMLECEEKRLFEGRKLISKKSWETVLGNPDLVVSGLRGIIENCDLGEQKKYLLNALGFLEVDVSFLKKMQTELEKKLKSYGFVGDE